MCSVSCFYNPRNSWQSQQNWVFSLLLPCWKSLSRRTVTHCSLCAQTCNSNRLLWEPQTHWTVLHPEQNWKSLTSKFLKLECQVITEALTLPVPLMGCDSPKAFNSAVNFPIVRHVSPTTKHTDTAQVICSPPLAGSLSAKQAEMTSGQHGNQSSLSHGTCQRISMLLSVASWCERSHLKQHVWLQKLQQFRRCNDNVLCYMLFLKIGAHSPLQSKEPKPQTKQIDHVSKALLFLIVLYVLLYRWVHFPRAVLFWRMWVV